MSAGQLRPGTVLDMALSSQAGDLAKVRVIASLERDVLAPEVVAAGTSGDGDSVASEAMSARAFAPLRGQDAFLVEVAWGGRVVIPGAWVMGEELSALAVAGHQGIEARDVRMPAFVIEEPQPGGVVTILAWGQGVWSLPLDARVALPQAVKPGVYGLAQLRRLSLVAAGRQDEVALTLWQHPTFEVPWRDLRMTPRARWWFELAQVPINDGYAGAARAVGAPVDALIERLRQQSR